MDAYEEAGFREIDHTADWELEVWAPSWTGLLEQAAAGMYEMTGVVYGSEVQATRRFELDHSDREALLVNFLSELLYLLHTEHLAFSRFNFKFDGGGEQNPEKMSVLAVGQPIASIDKEIKAVTWHEISVEETEGEFQGRVTFDV